MSSFSPSHLRIFFKKNPQIESNDICAEISVSGSVTFSDPPPQFTKTQLDSVLKEIQQQTALLGMLEQEMGKSKEFLSKVGFSNFEISLSTMILLCDATSRL